MHDGMNAPLFDKKKIFKTCMIKLIISTGACILNIHGLINQVV